MTSSASHEPRYRTSPVIQSDRKIPYSVVQGFWDTEYGIFVFFEKQTPGKLQVFRERHEKKKEVRRRRSKKWLDARERAAFTGVSTLVQWRIRSVGKHSLFFIFSFCRPLSAPSFILLLRHTGTSRGCSPLQPPAGAARPCTRFRCAP